MAWVQGEVRGLIAPDGRMTCAVHEIVVRDGPRPRTIEEAGADLDVFDRDRKSVV